MIQEDTFLTIRDISEGFYKEKGSKFLAFAYPVCSLDEIKEIIKTLRQEYFEARHWCFAYILGKDKSVYRANDDGEPSGSAGLPILGQIKSKNLTNVLVVVIRYFGGTKLGVSGLVNAYKTSTLDALENAAIIEEIMKDEIRFSFAYLGMNSVMKLIKEYDLEIVRQNFSNQCEITLLVRQKSVIEIKNKLQKIQEVEIVSE